MKINWKTYGRITAVFCVSCVLFALMVFLPIADMIKNAMSVPAAAALIAALYQILMDESRFIKEKSMKEEERLHVLSVSSHMAIVAFDKHTEFSEKYLEVMRNGLMELSAKGPCKEALEIAEKLKKTRLDYAAWITKDTRETLFPFEQALTMIGFNQGCARDMSAGDEKRAMLQKALNLFMQVMEYKEDKDIQKRGIGVSEVVENIQNLLGINELTRLRKQVIKEANKALDAMA
jgi:hypothetical protein